MHATRQSATLAFRMIAHSSGVNVHVKEDGGRGLDGLRWRQLGTFPTIHAANKAINAEMIASLRDEDLPDQADAREQRDDDARIAHEDRRSLR